MQLRSNHDQELNQERQKYYGFLQVVQVGHPTLFHNALRSGKEKAMDSDSRHERSDRMVRNSRTGQNLLMTGTDLLNGGTVTVISRRSESGRGIMCAKEDVRKYDMWYGVLWLVCGVVMSSWNPNMYVVSDQYFG
jgi:hypothetical protein